MTTVAEVSGPGALAETCSQCSHRWGDHLMHPQIYPYPTDGWITCPVPACTCRRTWSVEDHARRALERHREEFFSKVAAGGPIPARVGMDLWYYERRNEQWRAYEKTGSSDSRWLREMDALYLFGTIGTEAILRGNGEVWVRPDEHGGQPDAPEPQWRPADTHERYASLVIAAEKMPEIRSLLPTRVADAVDCTLCTGSGWVVGKVVCPHCDGLGWILSPAT